MTPRPNKVNNNIDTNIKLNCVFKSPLNLIPERGSASSVSQEAIVGMISAGFIMLILASISVLMLIRKRRIQAKERSPTQGKLLLAYICYEDIQ